MHNLSCPNEGTAMHRGKRLLTLTYKGARTTISMPGWYCGTCGEGIHSGVDMKVSDPALNLLKAGVGVL
jgi:HTH-type transcriptional regulator/antitoxin MqsA